MERQRLGDLDRGKGVAIFLVVLGHLTLSSRPIGNGWYTFLETMIYQFHMSFFMFMSGFIMYYTYPSPEDAKAYCQYIANKFVRLMPAFFVFAIAIAFGKNVLNPVIHVDNVQPGVLSAIPEILLRPTESSARSLWYIYVLFLYYLILPPILMLVRKRLGILLVLGGIIQACYLWNDYAKLVPYSTTSLFASHLVMRHFLVFCIGIYMAANSEKYYEMVDSNARIFISLFIASFAVLLLDVRPSVSRMIIGLLSVPALHSAVRFWPLNGSKFLESLGKYTFAIYLMNTISIGVAKGIILKFVSWDGHNFLFVAPLLLLSGIFIPIFLKINVFSKIRPLNFITS